MSIEPEDVRKHLARQSGAGADKPAGPAAEQVAGGAPVTQRAAAVAAREEAIQTSISASYFGLRRGLAALAIALPILLWLGAGYDHLQGSISAYYHFTPVGEPRYGAGASRDIMVAILCAAGAALFFYKGYSRRENMALNIAGVASVLIAIAPMDWPSTPDRSLLSITHTAAAVIFFLAIAFVCLFCSRDTLALLNDEARKTWFRRIYRVLGILMIVLPLAVVAHDLLRQSTGKSYVTFTVEVVAIYVFAAFWLVKSREIALIQKL